MKLTVPGMLGSVTALLLSVSSLAHAACWDKREYRDIENFSELDDKLILSYKDAVSCKALEGVKVQLGKLKYTTDLNGYVSLPMAPFIQAGNLDMPMMISKNGYTTVKTELKVVAGTVLNKRMLLSPSLSGNSMRFILQWNDEPKDLDLHLQGNDFHVSYRHMRAAGEATLDQDEQGGFGPETITLKNVRNNQRYIVSVVNYSGDAAFDESAKVLVYIGDHLDSVIPLTESSQRKIDVLEITNAEIKKLIKSPGATSAAVIPGW